jgi:hypothetical protein
MIFFAYEIGFFLKKRNFNILNNNFYFQIRLLYYLRINLI